MWDAISAPTASPMLSHAWIRAWAEVYQVDSDLEFRVAGEGRAAAIAPLVRARRGGPRFELAGPDNLLEEMDFLYADGTHVPELATALVRARLPLRLWRVPAESPVIPALTEASRGRALIRRWVGTASPSLPLDPTWVNAADHLDSHRRSNLRRARRIAESLGPVTTEILTPRPDEVERLLDEAYAVEAAGWKAREGSPLSRDRLLGAFFRRYGKAAAESGEFRVCFLRIGGHTAAMKLASVTGNRFWLLAMGFAEEYERCSPGTLLLMETIAYAARSGLDTYEFLGGDEPWVRALNPTPRPCVAMRTYPFGLLGAMALASDGFDRVRSRLRAVRAPVGRFYADMEQHLARAYSAGPTPEDAVRKAAWLAGMGYGTIVGYMHKDNEDPRSVSRSTLASLEGVAAKRLDCYVSIKAPAFGFDRRRITEIVTSAQAKDIRIHFDALAATDVDPTFSLIREMQAFHGNLGCTLPGRWKRSAEDVERAVDLGVNVRVIKGEWADRKEHERDPRVGFLDIVERLAGRVPRVGVATHNPTLARKAVRRLRAAGTPCEIEVVRGYPIHRVLPVAVEEKVPMRVYVPYGNVAFPYTLEQVLRRPRIAVWVLRDVFRGGTSVVPPDPRRSSGTGPIGSR
ncbi:MAG TPA: GNAT family N-acetyltransferase [Thermoplasmata archaeon]|nr:GNAT family N-acetyltransferase [Thermoplasmata archaeon]